MSTRSVQYALALCLADATTERKGRLCRPDGSYVEKWVCGPGGSTSWARVSSLEETVKVLHSVMDWKRVNPADLPPATALPMCTYYKGTLPPQYMGRDMAFTLGEAIELGVEIEVRVNKPGTDPNDPNPLGWGLFSPYKGWNGSFTQEVWAITGPRGAEHGPGDSLWTWFPGRMARPVTKAEYLALALVKAGDKEGLRLLPQDLIVHV